ncbi:hypothetical protein L1N85_10685 [Paenibacillus alkaliterrae]|uniref:phage adaptor protein n=1 Tax=Paenibacillus alkaliterrae TaxID=320909 RepID=UPI001F2221C7|nr:hypothetical protein [Paenibacillus alkaliterrae]MCF2938902.1 hypothetical protein [Paenibacillus alkaliterrae]
MSAYTASQLATIIKMACKKDMPDLGEDTDQDFYIFEWLNMFLQQNARKAFLDTWSDDLSVTTSGYYTFKRSSQDITNLYEPQMVYKYTAGQEKYEQVRPLRSFDSGDGWFRGGPDSKIYMRNQSGTFRLYYLRYPAKITLGTQTPEYPPAGYGELISWVVSRIKYTKNYLEESKMVAQDANASRFAAVKAATAARGSNQAPPSEYDANMGG